MAERIEKIQESAHRFVLEMERERNVAIMTYEIQNGLAPDYLKTLLTPGRNSKLMLPYFKTTKHGLNSVSYRAFGIPSFKTRSAPYLSSFK